MTNGHHGDGRTFPAQALPAQLYYASSGSVAELAAYAGVACTPLRHLRRPFSTALPLFAKYGALASTIGDSDPVTTGSETKVREEQE